MNAIASHHLALHLAHELGRREAELRDLLRAANDAAVHAIEDAQQARDIKDIAAGEAQGVVADATLAHASHELAQVTAARRRLAEGRYGCCQDCGARIEARRLLAWPAAALCAACQSDRERLA